MGGTTEPITVMSIHSFNFFDQGPTGRAGPMSRNERMAPPPDNGRANDREDMKKEKKHLKTFDEKKEAEVKKFRKKI